MKQLYAVYVSIVTDPTVLNLLLNPTHFYAILLSRCAMSSINSQIRPMHKSSSLG